MSLAPLSAVLAAAPSATGTASGEPAFDPNQVSPGLIGFLCTFAVVLVCVFLFRDLTKRIRRLQFRGDQEAARLAAAGGTPPPARRPVGSPPPGARRVGLTKDGGPGAAGRRPLAPPVRRDDPVGPDHAPPARSAPPAPPARADETDGFRENRDTRD